MIIIDIEEQLNFIATQLLINAATLKTTAKYNHERTILNQDITLIEQNLNEIKQLINPHN